MIQVWLYRAYFRPDCYTNSSNKDKRLKWIASIGPLQLLVHAKFVLQTFSSPSEEEKLVFLTEVPLDAIGACKNVIK